MRSGEGGELSADNRPLVSGDRFTGASPTARSPSGALVGPLLLLSCIAIWGVNSVAFRMCTRPATGVGFDPVLLTGIRFLLVAPCMAAFIGWRQPSALRLQPEDWKRYIIFGFVAIVLAETLQPLSLLYTSVANLTLLSHGTISLFTAFWAMILFKQRIARAGWIGAVLALIGVGIVAANGGHGGFRLDAGSLRGDGIAIFRSFEHSLYLLVLSRWLQKRPVLQVSLYNCVFGALWLLPYVIWRGITFPWHDVPASVWLWLLWTVFPATLYGFLAWNWAMSRVGALTATNMFYLMPVAATLSAWALLGEPVTAGQALGGLVILCGILLLRWDTLIEAGVIRGLPEIRLPWRK